MKDFGLKEGLRWLNRLRETLPPIKPVEIKGYSLKKMMLLGLILPAIVASSLFSSLYVSMRLGLPLGIVGIVTCLWTFAGFAVGIFVVLNLSNKILEYAKVRKKC